MEGVERWFDRLVAATELGLRKGSFEYAPQGPVEIFKISARIAKTLESWSCPGCSAVIAMRRPLEDGTVYVCPACYGCYDIELVKY